MQRLGRHITYRREHFAPDLLKRFLLQLVRLLQFLNRLILLFDQLFGLSILAANLLDFFLNLGGFVPSHRLKLLENQGLL